MMDWWQLTTQTGHRMIGHLHFALLGFAQGFLFLLAMDFGLRIVPKRAPMALQVFAGALGAGLSVALLFLLPLLMLDVLPLSKVARISGKLWAAGLIVGVVLFWLAQLFVRRNQR